MVLPKDPRLHALNVRPQPLSDYEQLTTESTDERTDDDNEPHRGGSLARRIDKSKRGLDRGALERQIGRLLERNTHAAARFSIAIIEDKTAAAGLALEWSTHPEWDDWAAAAEGTYILRTNIHDWSDEDLWKTYIQLTEAEESAAAFRL
ncbi:MAG: hypothetical protein A3F74_10395 [Betaproteobacteria bacterium RIFCSPLOWO2_12_FULL_62_58]|nr:MAG: hypothetical protein A3F74_10395 [Betaproteobacteria bacterium RIFCSPLOWO2_12_FULL_62_58]